MRFADTNTADWLGPPVYDDLIDQVERLAEQLNDDVGTVPLAEAQDVVKRLQRAERTLWKFRRSVESAWWAKHADVVEIIMLVAGQERRRASEVMYELLDDGALVPVWWKLDKYAAEHGVAIEAPPPKDCDGCTCSVDEQGMCPHCVNHDPANVNGVACTYQATEEE